MNLVPESPAPELSTSDGSAIQKPSSEPRLSRRALVGGSVAIAAGGGLFGCRRSQPSNSDPAPPRRDVPLRIDWMGSEPEARALERAWGTVSDQPLDVTVSSLRRDASSGMTQRLIDSSSRHDVLVYPLAALGALASADAIVRLGEEDQESIDQAHGSLLPALRHGAARHAGEVLSVPLGGRLPALLAVDSLPELSTWADYDAWVASIDGAAGEPLADGWAGAMFLWRAAATLRRGWLFDRQNMRPLVDTKPYLAVLRQMKTTADRYQERRQTPEQIWIKLTGGEVRGGIGFPVGAGSDDAAVQVGELPAPGGRHHVMLDPFTPLASLSAGCRQSAAAKRFLKWLAGGESSQAVRRQVDAMTVTRESSPQSVDRLGGDSAGAGRTDGSAGDYSNWLREQLSVGLTRPTLRLLKAGEYYAALDDQIGRCLDGKASSEESLASVATQWQKITRAVGMEQQRRCWMRAQGMRAPA